MYGYNDFHESCYNHSCTIIPERDVLDIDIVGSGFVVRFRRWWHNLFLLSYSDERSKAFYNSSHAMRMERMSQFRRYRNRIHPLSKFSKVWGCFLLHVFIVNKLLFHFTSTVLFDQLDMSYYYTGAVLELIIISDLFISFKTGFINEEARRLVLDPKKCIMHYCSRKLFIHVASAIPLTWIMFLRLGRNINCGLCKANYFVCFLKILNIFSLYRLYEVSSIFTRTGGTCTSTKTHVFRFVRIGTLGLVTMFQFLDISDMVCLLNLMRAGKMARSSSFYRQLVLYKYSNEEHFSNFLFAVDDLGRSFKSLFLFGFESDRISNVVDIVSSLIAYVIANLFYLWSLIETYALINRLNYPKEHNLMLKHSALNLLECRQLPDKLRSKVEQYFEFKPSKCKIFEVENGLYQSIPSALKREAALNCYSKYLRRIHHFMEWPVEIIEELVFMLQREIYLKNDVVAEAWVQGEGLVVVDLGVLAVYSVHHVELGHLIDGDYFGEVSLVTDREMRMSHIVAVTSCSVLILRKTAFRMFMRRYPKLFFDMKKSLQESYSEAPTSASEAFSTGLKDDTKH